MILGWSLPQEMPGSSFEEVQISGVSLLFPLSADVTARTRALLQLELASTRESFLPSAPHFEVSRAGAVNWTKSHADALIGRLNMLTGYVQVTAQLGIGATVQRRHEDSWLRAKMRRHIDLRTRCRRFERSLHRVARGVDARGLGTRSLATGLAVDLLVHAGRAEAAKQDIASAVLPSKEPCAVVGPLPAYGFSNLTETICTTA